MKYLSQPGSLMRICVGSPPVPSSHSFAPTPERATYNERPLFFFGCRGSQTSDNPQRLCKDGGVVAAGGRVAEREQPVLPVHRFRQQRSTRSLALSLSMRLSLSLSLSLPEPVVARAGRARNLLPRVRQSAAPARIGRGELADRQSCPLHVASISLPWPIYAVP